MSGLARHPVFWFDDGSIVFRVENHVFKVHKTLLSRHSNFFARPDHTLSTGNHGITSNVQIDPHIIVDPSRRVRTTDVEALLEHVYHDAPIYAESKFPRLISILRVSSPQQLDFPSLHALAKAKLDAMFRSGEMPLYRPDDLHEAIDTAKEYQLHAMRKAMYYHFVTSPDSSSEPETTHPSDDSMSLPSALGASTQTLAEQVEAKIDTHQPALSPSDTKLCAQLMERVIEHFTPTLFTPPATAHRACTDVFADTWMTVVIQPAIDDNGVYKPLETLELIKGVDWGKLGLCRGCLEEKKEEWTKEQRDIWRAMDGWLDIGADRQTA
ncbi:hypothetical protein LshimejAT787_0200270 [Lyophyllum shimeji]|uniref:BTB domain-containing protein n=1 Tax=Lyophyllum shimeji TaxID=47721 RepID=A0A9P3PEI1_LYOSH|nr:hypothetical protein LshimejAT787_0200270 [Lyophyllum shimeji]